MKTVDKLYERIMEYWGACAYTDPIKDSAINSLLEEYALSCGIDENKLGGRIDITVRNMTNSQKRKLYQKMLESNIK